MIRFQGCLARASHDDKWKIAIFIVLLSLLVRVIYILLAVEIDPIIANNPLYADAYGYNLLAHNLLTEKIFSWDGLGATSYRAPGYPVFLAVIYAIVGENLIAVRLVQAFVGALISLPIFWIGNMFGGVSLAIISGLGIAFFPLLLYMTSWLYSETIYIFVLWLGVWLLCILFHKNEMRQIILAGFILGIATLIRPQFIVYPLGCLVLGFFAHWERKTIVSFALVQIVVFFMIFPWTYRNYVVHKEIVLISTDTGPNLFGANNPNADGGFALQDWDIEGLTEIESDKEFRRRALEWISNNPGKFLKLLPLKVIKFFSPLETTTAERSLGKAEKIIDFIYFIFLFFSFIGGIWLVIENRARESLNLVALFVYATMITLIFHGGARLALPIGPVFIIFFAYALLKGIRLISNYL